MKQETIDIADPQPGAEQMLIERFMYEAQHIKVSEEKRMERAMLCLHDAREKTYPSKNLFQLINFHVELLKP